MNCPHQGCAVPPCQIAPHPDRHNIEYCRVCAEWRHISDIGSDAPNVFWSIVAVAITLTLFISLTNESQTPSYEQNYTQPRQID
ncbi:hypothetical protein JOY44_19850 [Phormidium sp. CLA17]|uniref:hypothetical protein n=1 Tax=Leptolyngbya sp. Cla-17 TaxID=2803751 RepID=UPI0014911220|nr:hypothetical protein [Leptolyngbya sp. Cla-17]MBM0743845.1 hypothetical protein [Leptolyngbya sp. Cla-17]